MSGYASPANAQIALVCVKPFFVRVVALLSSYLNILDPVYFSRTTVFLILPRIKNLSQATTKVSLVHRQALYH